MLNSRALAELLSQNSDERLCKRWFLMTANGTLLAYTEPTDLRELRKQASVAALSWQEHQAPRRVDSVEDDEEEPPDAKVPPTMISTLTVESESANLIMRKIQPQLLLVLEGGVPPRRRTFEPKVTPEGPGDAPYPTQENLDGEPLLGSPARSVAESTKSTAAISVLGLQRRKLDALAAAIAQDLDKTGFKMPDDGVTKFF